MSRFRRLWSSLNFYKEYLFGFETLVFATSGILSIHEQLVTLQRERKFEIAPYDPFKVFGLINLLFVPEQIDLVDGRISSRYILYKFNAVYQSSYF